jgi:hypothetical protein
MEPLTAVLFGVHMLRCTASEWTHRVAGFQLPASASSVDSLVAVVCQRRKLKNTTAGGYAASCAWPASGSSPASHGFSRISLTRFTSSRAM